MELRNLSDTKIIGIGDVVVLPGETKQVPLAFEHNPILEVYKAMGFAEITGEAKTKEKTPDEIAAEKEEAAKRAAEDAEALRKARLASLKGITEEGLGSLAKELGINPADCKDQKDVLSKVKAALK